MHTTYSTLLAFAALHLPRALAHPLADHPQPPAHPEHYYMISQDIRDGTPFTGGISVLAGGSLQITEEYSFSTTVEAGVDLALSIAKVIDLGLSASIQQTTTTTVGESGTVNCPDGPWTCALQITPSVLHVKGHKDYRDIFGTDRSGDFVVGFPRVDKAKNAKVDISPCACHNRAGWAAAGAPPLCPSDCD